MSAWLWKIGLVFLVCIGIWTWGDHHGSTAQAAADTKKINTANDDRDAAYAQIGVLTSKLDAITAQAKQDKADADQRKKDAEQAVKELAKEQDLRKKDLAAWNHQLDLMKVKPECGALKELLCPAVMDY